MHMARYSEPSWDQTSKNSTISQASYLRNGPSCSDQVQSNLRWLDPKLKSWLQLHERPWARTTNLNHFQILKLQKLNSVQFSHSVVSDSLQPHESQHARPPCPSPSPGVYPNSHPSSRWGHPAISSSVIPFSSCPQSLPASGSFPMSQLFALGGQSTGVSALASFLPKKSQGWSPSEWTGWISLQSKGLSRVFSNTWATSFSN